MEIPDRLKNFFAFYLLALVLHYTESWEHPFFIAVFSFLAVVVLLSRFRAIFLLAFALTAFLQIFLFKFPDLANHMRVFLGCNLAVAIFSFALVVRQRSINEDSRILAGLAPALMLAFVATYLFTGFHKLNWGFLCPENSCITNFGNRFLNAYWLGNINSSPSLFPLLVGFVYTWELVLPFCLLFRKTQFLALPVCLGMHWLLSPTGFLDFSSLAFSILILFLNDRYHGEIENHPLRIRGRSFGRREFLFLVNLAGGWIAGFMLEQQFPFLQSLPNGVETLTGWLFIVTALVFLWPALRLIARERMFRGRSFEWRKLHWIYALPLSWILFNGFQPYLGLSTGGAFSMFSNLRTEGPKSNHLILGSNPFKVFSFQEDVVEIHDSPPGVSDHGLDINGHDIPMVEFRKMLVKWKWAGRKVPLTLEYKGRRHTSENICEDPEWQLGLEIYDRLLDFRIIPREGPNKCQW